jgi:DNA-binding transcriptional MerR regulator
MKDFNIKKLYYSIREVSKIADVEQYVLRFWETEFEQLKPQKNRAGNRIYTNKDIEFVLLIKSLLRDKKYTIEGAKQVLIDQTKSKEMEALKDRKQQDLFDMEPQEEEEPVNQMDEDDSNSVIIKDLKEIRSLLVDVLEKL